MSCYAAWRHYITPDKEKLLSERLQPILLVPDVHAPFHHKHSWDLLLDVAKDIKPSIIVVIGDFLDCFCISSYGKDPDREHSLKKEVRTGQDMLKQLESLGAKRLVYVEGNHEYRLKRYLQDKAPELFGLIDIPSMLFLHNWEFVEYRDHVKIGKLHYTHDVGITGRYATLRTLDTYQHSVVHGHDHRIQYVVEGNAVGEAKLGAQFGWLGDVNKVDYMNKAKARKNWALGFGVGYLDAQTQHTFWTPVPIVSNRCVVNGKLYKSPRLRKK